uniref:Uncharacterized protein n=1 Tax=Papilio xuthus TaxID=66420 RepID=I4DQI0_PAPXU|nr:unknown unsecreted protein [Papilio xuthus]
MNSFLFVEKKKYYRQNISFNMIDKTVVNIDRQLYLFCNVNYLIEFNESYVRFK